MDKQSNIRRLLRAILSLSLVFIALALTVGNALGRYSTKVPNIIGCAAATDASLYVIGLDPFEDSETESSDSEENSALPGEINGTSDELVIDRSQLFTSSEWRTQGGEQYITFTVANSQNGQVASRDVAFRIRVVFPDAENEVSDNEVTDGEVSDAVSDYISLNFSLEADNGKFYSRIDSIHPQTSFFIENGISGWMYRFCETINDEVLYTLSGGASDEIEFTLSVHDTEFDCSGLMIYIDRIS